MGFESFGLDRGNPDFVEYAECYGAHGHRVESAPALVPLVAECYDPPGEYVIDVPIDYSENDRRLNYEIPWRSQEV